MASNRRLSLGVGQFPGLAIPAILVGTALLELQSPDRSPMIPFAPWIMVGLQLGTPVLLMPRVDWCRQRFRSAFFTVVAWLYGLFLLALASAFWSEFPNLVFTRSLVILGSILLIGLLVLADRQPVGTLVRVARVLSAYGVFLAAVGILLFFVGTEGPGPVANVQSLVLGPITLEQVVYGRRPLLRISSLTGNPNTLAMFLLITLSLTVFLIRSQNISRAIGMAFLCVQLVALGMTFSRTGIVATVLAVLLYNSWSAVALLSRVKRLVVSILLVVCLLALGFEVGGEFSENAQGRLRADLSNRDAIWAPLVQSISTRPMAGVGFGVSNEGILEKVGIHQPAHNAHLMILAEIGVPGYLLLLLLWVGSVVVGVKSGEGVRDPNLRHGIAAAAAILATLLVHQLFESYVLRYGFANILWGYLIFVVIRLGFCRGSTEFVDASCTKRCT